MSNIYLGPVCLENPFILAPMAGITDSPFRRVVRKRGCGMVLSPLISANAIKHGNQKTSALLDFAQEERPLGIQIFGSDSSLLCQAAAYAEFRGADFIDLNLGCSVPKVSGKGAGSALCRDLFSLEHLLRELVACVKVPVSIKIRLGWDERSRNAVEVVKMAADVGVQWAAIHGRTSEQLYSGKADWESIARIKEKSPIPILGNGDLTTPELALDRLRKYGVDAIMIGRGALHNPFIFKQTLSLWRGEEYQEASCEEYLELIREHQQNLFAHYPSQRALLHLRKFLVWYSSGFPGCHKFRRLVFSILDIQSLWQETQSFFSQVRTKESGERLDEPLFTGGHG